MNYIIIHNSGGSKGNIEKKRVKVKIEIKVTFITALADTGVQINILPQSIAAKLNHPIQRSRSKVEPFGLKQHLM